MLYEEKSVTKLFREKMQEISPNPLTHCIS